MQILKINICIWKNPEEKSRVAVGALLVSWAIDGIIYIKEGNMREGIGASEGMWMG
jgi:hypothetical protein